MKKAYSLVEILLAMAIVGVIMVIALTTLSNNQPNESKILFLKTYKEFSQVIENLVNDSSLYPPCNGNNCPASFRNFPLSNTFMAVMEDGTEIGACIPARGNCTPGSTQDTDEREFKFIRAFLNSFNIILPADPLDWPSEIEFKNGIKLLNHREEEDLKFDDIIMAQDRMFRIKLTVDVNGDKEPNCIYNEEDPESCSNPDRFILYVAGDGKIYFGDKMGYVYVQQSNSLRKNDIENMENIENVNWRDNEHPNEQQFKPDDDNNQFSNYFIFPNN